jgi:Cd(II)/Pb(II)-responsive transcriptional regulator
MRIGELAQSARCDVQTVRFYEREGLLEEPEREPSGYRRYDVRHLSRLNFIRHCRSLDIPLAEVRQLLEFAARPDQSCAKVNALLDDHIELVKDRIASLRVLQTQLVTLRKTCDGDSSHACAILESFVNAAEQQACACHTEAGAARRAPSPMLNLSEKGRSGRVQ